MSKCKECGCNINFEVFGMPPDLCYGCLTSPEKMATAEKNIPSGEIYVDLDEEVGRAEDCDGNLADLLEEG